MNLETIEEIKALPFECFSKMKERLPRSNQAGYKEALASRCPSVRNTGVYIFLYKDTILYIGSTRHEVSSSGVSGFYGRVTSTRLEKFETVFKTMQWDDYDSEVKIHFFSVPITLPLIEYNQQVLDTESRLIKHWSGKQSDDFPELRHCSLNIALTQKTGIPLKLIVHALCLELTGLDGDLLVEKHLESLSKYMDTYSEEETE